MNKKLFVIICVAFIVIGAVVSVLTEIPESQLIGLAITMFGAGGLCSNIWKERKKEEHGLLVVLTMALVGIGSFMAGVSGILTEDTLKTIITLTVALVLIIAGLVTTKIAQKKLE